MNWRDSAKRLLRLIGYEVSKFDHLHAPLKRRLMLMHSYGISLIFDVGANSGQYAHLMRQYGYEGRIVSFEPIDSVFAELEANAENDDRWIAVHSALGDYQGTTVINVAADKQCSSVLQVTDRFRNVTRAAEFTGQEPIRLSTLDAEFGRYYETADQVLVKIDTQGYEKRVVDGSRRIIDKIQGFQLELSLVPLYEGEAAFVTMISYLSDLGFNLMSIEPTHADASSGRLLQVDALFFRDEPTRDASGA
ncbi:MAG TPA: FkbM family methyltransferase [Rhodothermales bacterium]|nr:FkbM family methyltransferase [Rhodothermales bacterium]